MKKYLIGGLVGAIIIFVWQFLSWSLLPLHNSAYTYTENQDAIIGSLSSSLKEDGQYMLPGSPPGATQEEREKIMESMNGKPWATVNYHASYNESMTTNMIRGFVVDLVLVILLIWVLGKSANLTISSAMGTAIGIGLISWMFSSYTYHIWFQTPSGAVTADLIDSIVAFGLTGIWLGWWVKGK